MKRLVLEAEHEAFRDTVRQFITQELEPNAERWEADRLVDRSAWVAAGKHGQIFSGLANDEQKQRWLPGITSGELIVAVAMTEPGAGSDLAGIKTSAVRDGDDWIINGAKTFISSGILSDLVVVVCRTDPNAGHEGFTLYVVEDGMEGFTRGRKLDKMGLHYQDTAELNFDNVRVPSANLLGKEGRGFYHLTANCRRSDCPSPSRPSRAHAKPGGRPCSTPRTARPSGSPSVASSTTAFCWPRWTPNSRLASSTSTAASKPWSTANSRPLRRRRRSGGCTETAKKVIDGCVQLHGGYGYMTECRVARDYMDNRIMTIFGGTTEIMKDISAAIWVYSSRDLKSHYGSVLQ